MSIPAKKFRLLAGSAISVVIRIIISANVANARGADLVTEQLLDMLHLTPLLRLKPFLGKLMDQSLWFTHWPPVQNVTGQPAIALPVHLTGDGLPLGIQAAGRVGEEETLLPAETLELWAAK